MQNSPTSIQHRKKLFIAFTILLTGIYFSTGTGGIYGSNDGGHFALIKAITEQGRFDLGRFANFTGYVNVAFLEDRFYSDKPPGTAIFALPFYCLGHITSLLLSASSDPSDFESLEPGDVEAAFPFHSVETLFLSIFPAFTSALSVMLAYSICRLLGATPLSGIITGIIIGFGTLNWKYGMLLYSHSLSTSLGLLVLFLLLKLKTGEIRNVSTYLLFLGLTCGYTIMVDYVNAIPFAVYSLYLYWISRDLKWKGPGQMEFVGRYVLGAAIPIGGILLYQYVNFNSIFATTYKYSYVYEYARSPISLFSGNFSEGFIGLLFGEHRNGLFYASPVAVLGIWGYYFFWKRQRKEAIIFALLGMLPILLISKHQEWWGGGFDHRYIFTASTFLILPMCFWIDRFINNGPRIQRVISLCIFVGLALYSVIFQASSILELIQSYGRGVYLVNTGQVLYSATTHFNMAGFIYLSYTVFVSFAIYYTAALGYRWIITKKLRRSDLSGLSISLIVIPVMFLFSEELILRNPNVLQEKVIYQELFGGSECTEFCQDRKNIRSSKDILYPEDYNEPGMIYYEVEVKRPARFVLVQWVATVAYQESAFWIEINSNGGEYRRIHSFRSDIEKKEKGMIDILPFIQNKRAHLKIGLVVDSRYSKTLADARLEEFKISVVEL